MICPGCGNTLRKDNQRGACARCVDAGTVKPNAEKPDYQIMRRFRTVARGLGLEPARLIEGFARDFLERAASRVAAMEKDPP
jgi:hypothetical protein